MLDIRKGNCPLCDWHEIIEAVPGEFADQSREVVPAVTYDARWVLSGRNPEHPHGPLLMYVCRRCGYCQQFAQGADAIPIGDNYKTRLIKGVERATPYR